MAAPPRHPYRFSRRGRDRLPRTQPLTGRVIAVTGAGRGIGRAVAARLAAAGAAVAIGDLDAALATEAAGAIGALGAHPGGRLLGLSLDVTDTHSFDDFLRTVETRLGPIDVLINNAGIMWVGPFAEEPEEAALRQFDVNVHGALRGMKLVIPGMRKRGRGHVVNIASAASKVAPAGEATYAATKHAVHGYSTAVRAELRGTGVHVSLVMPGVVDTELAVGTATGPTRRLTTDQVADAVLDVVLRPRFEVFVPRQVAALTRLAAVLPGRARDALHRLLVPDQLAALSDRTVRAAYEQRTRTARLPEG
ncbi:SDR family oxidoreductase [Streptomyces doebereineriae]|uniref:SDR family oxidoreductase n=1 Tax=Streptomyces doebereineriae TaxID=3075528 RepID=A0ABU2V1F8_9ACTN|nr:SDR family oxidoreductase [Streptomyces sp. DSM 41640]MDT0479389.1 SDR family oxidoreductase [Streptomyces sp. DSM 41640]